MSHALRASSHLTLPLLAGVSLVAFMVAVPARADAQVCATNGDCPSGTICQQTSVPSAEPGCAGSGCPMTGTDGSTGKGLVAPDAVVMSCVPAPCQVDSDCGGQMICHTEVNSVCSGGAPTACPRDTKCEQTAPPTCTETKVSTCAYKWQQPCSADADCGDGFTCQPSMVTSCSGGGAVPVSGSGTGSASPGSSGPVGAGGSSGSTGPSDAPARVAPAVDGGTTDMCTTTTSFPGWCRPKAATCTTDADCPSTWTCVDGNVAGTGSSGPGQTTSGGSSGSGSAGVAQPTSADDATSPTSVVSVKVCQSPISFPVRGGVGTDVGAPKGPTSSGGLTSGAGNGAPEVATHGSNAGCSVAGTSPYPLAGFAALLLGLALAAGRRGQGRDR